MKVLVHLRYFFSKKETAVAGLLFSFNSFLFGNWVTRIPDVKDKIGLTDSELGLALLGAPIGAMIVMPISGWIIAKFQLGRATLIGTISHTIAPVFLAYAHSYWTLLLGMVYFGLTTSLMDISINAVAAATEKKLRRPVMSTCHGMWSFGAMAGSASGSLVLGLKLPLQIHLVAAVILVLIIIFLFFEFIAGYREQGESGGKILAIPNLPLLGLAIMGFCILLSEGAIADWTAIYMKETLLSNPFLVGLAYSSYSFLMALGRFSGDFIIPRIGKKRTVMWGGLISVFGLGVTLLLANQYFAIIGFGLTGIGYSCIIPVLFSSAANEPGFTPGAGIASVATIGYAGFLFGPPVIGQLSDAFGMPVALSVVVVLSLIVSVMATFITFK